MAALHAVDYTAAALSGYGKSGRYIERQVARWTEQYPPRNGNHRGRGAAHRVAAAGDIPAGEETSIVPRPISGLDNAIFHPREPSNTALLDWRLSTLGHPFGSIWRTCACAIIWSAEQFHRLTRFGLAGAGIPDEPNAWRTTAAAAGGSRSRRRMDLVSGVQHVPLNGDSAGVLARGKSQGNASTPPPGGGPAADRWPNRHGLWCSNHSM